jgi:hypothetical protein
LFVASLGGQKSFHEMDIDALIRMKHLTEDQRQDTKALQKAVLRLLTRPRRTSRDA